MSNDLTGLNMLSGGSDMPGTVDETALGMRGRIAQLEQQLATLRDTINEEWVKAYQAAAGSEPVTEVRALRNRVVMLADDRKCQADNFRTTNAAYVKENNERRRLESLLNATPVAWVAVSPHGDVLHLSVHDGWKVDEVMTDTSTGRLTLDTPRQVFFYEQDHYYLSNFSAFPIEWEGHLFATAEHAYHFAKFPGLPHHRAFFKRLDVSAHEAFKYAGRHKADRMPDWDAVKCNVMKDILVSKVRQHEYVRRKLLETGERTLIENSWRDDYWGWGAKRDGINRLGKLWMEVREDLRAGRI